MRILMSGASGQVGRALTGALEKDGHHVVPLRRGTSDQGGVSWNPRNGDLLSGTLEGLDAVIHLAGDNISEGRWTGAKKRLIRDSRRGPTRFLSEKIAALGHPPKAFLSASAIGIYGDRGEEVLDENSAPGQGFLPDVCVEWEAATEPAESAGLRVCHLRLGAVLSRDGGALGKMKVPFQLGVGGPLGDGRQWFSWIGIDDVTGAVKHLLEHPDLSGPVNLTAPNAVRNAEFSMALGRVLKRPALMRAPAAALRLALGEVADAVLLSSARVQPEALTLTGYTFRFPEIEPALRHLLKK